MKPSNYRPVLLISIPCKILERIVAEKVTTHLLDNDFLLKHQHVFLKDKSYTTYLLEYMDTVTSGLADGHSFDILYTDLSKVLTEYHTKSLFPKYRRMV
jgi:hypothetical protein